MSPKPISLNGVTYVSARSAAQVVGIVPDYVTRLCREGKVDGIRVRNAWRVDLASLKAFAVRKEREKATYYARLAQEHRHRTISRPSLLRRLFAL